LQTQQLTSNTGSASHALKKLHLKFSK